MLISLITICRLTDDFIQFQKQSEKKWTRGQPQSSNDRLFKHIMQFGSNEDKMAVQVDRKLLNASLMGLMNTFSIPMFQNFIFIAGVRFEGSYSNQSVRVLDRNQPRFISVPHPIKMELFWVKKKRKDDMMSSLLKFNQRHILEQFKKNKTFKLIRNVKKEFRREFFADDPETEAIYYSNLFNRRQLERLGTHERLLRQIRSCYEINILSKLFHENFVKKSLPPILDLKTEKLFSSDFLKLLLKKHMNLGDALFSFYRIEDYIFKSHREQINSQKH